jgi:hypothetical protein
VLWLLEKIGARYGLTKIASAQRRSADTSIVIRWGASRRFSWAMARRCLIRRDLPALADLNLDAGLIGPIGSTSEGLLIDGSCLWSLSLRRRCFAGSESWAKGSPSLRRAIASPRRPRPCGPHWPRVTGLLVIASASLM